MMYKEWMEIAKTLDALANTLRKAINVIKKQDEVITNLKGRLDRLEKIIAFQQPDWINLDD